MPLSGIKSRSSSLQSHKRLKQIRVYSSRFNAGRYVIPQQTRVVLIYPSKGSHFRIKVVKAAVSVCPIRTQARLTMPCYRVDPFVSPLLLECLPSSIGHKDHTNKHPERAYKAVKHISSSPCQKGGK